MQIAHRAHAALVELVEELNERSSERGPWALTVQPGCNIATVRKCMMMIKHGPRDREFIDAVVERGNELVRPIDLARMMRSGEEWASEDHGVIFYRLVRVLNGARAIAPDETEFGRRDDVARDVQEAMTHAAELGFVVLHEGKAYTDHMHEITIPNGTRFGTTRHASEIKKANKPSFGTKGHQRDMVRKIEINEVDKGEEKTKEKVCCPVFVSGDTRFLVRCIGTMRNTETPVQVEGVHLTERLVCKHVTLYHPVSWPRRKQDLCVQKEPVADKKPDTTEARKAEELKKQVEKMRGFVEKWTQASDAFIHYAKEITKECKSIIEHVMSRVNLLKEKLTSFLDYNTQTRKDELARIRETLSDMKKRISDGWMQNTVILANAVLEALKNAPKLTNTDYMRSLASVQVEIQDNVMYAKDALYKIEELLYEHALLSQLLDETGNVQAQPSRSWFAQKAHDVFSYASTTNDEKKQNTQRRIHAVTVRYDIIEQETGSYEIKQGELKRAFQSKIEELENTQPTQDASGDEAQEEPADEREETETKTTKNREKEESIAPLDGPDLNTTQVPHDADMCVAVQVSGELFRIVHLTRDVETQREKKAKREGEEGEEAKRAKKTKRAQKEEKAEKAEKAEQEEIKKYDDAEYAKQMKKNKDGTDKGHTDSDVVRLDADYDDYKECVSAARKYLEETCIVNDTTESWSSAGWRLTKGCREEASGTGGSSGTSGSANFGHLEASDRLELVLVPRNLFGHVYGKGHEPTYDGNAEISKDGIWIYEANGRGKVCPKCTVCEKSEHNGKKNKSGLFVLYNKSDKNRIRGLSSRFCFHQQV